MKNLIWVLIIKICVAENEDRFDCLPNTKQNKTECLSRGCIWSDEVIYVSFICLFVNRRVFK